MAANFSRIVLEKGDGFAKVTLNRPQVKNCIDGQTLEELEAAFEDIKNDEAVRVAVLTGGGDIFSSGADLKYVASLAPHQFPAFIGLYHRVCNRIQNLSKPVIAAVNGLALAGGLELVMACDIVIASEEARLGDHHANIGAIPGGGGSQRLPRIVGEKRAKELLLTGRWITAEEAERIGLVNRVVPAAQLEALVREMVNNLVDKNPAAMRSLKYLVNQGLQTDLMTGLEMEKFAITQLYAARAIG